MSSKKHTTRPVAAQPAQKRRRPARRPNPWNPMGPLLVGLCFGLAYVVTGRLLEDRLGGLVPLGRRFSSKPVPGLTLESLRMRYGADSALCCRWPIWHGCSRDLTAAAKTDSTRATSLTACSCLITTTVHTTTTPPPRLASARGARRTC